MKKIFAGAIFCLATASAALAQTGVTPTPAKAPVDSIASPAAPAPVGPSIQFAEQKFDFGNIKPGDIVEHTFTFTNNGSLPLIITNVRTTCGCTATDYPKAPVMPGDSATISARFDSKGKRGAQNKVITVESNAIQGNTQVMIVTNILANK